MFSCSLWIIYILLSLDFIYSNCKAQYRKDHGDIEYKKGKEKENEEIMHNNSVIETIF